ncbi:hypothetical protein D3C76_1198200 [compost metagenome]
MFLATQLNRHRQAQFHLCTVSQIIDRPQINLGTNLGLRIAGKIKQLLAHALIAQRHAAVVRIHLDHQLGRALAIDLAVQHQETMDFGGIAVFAGDERQS